MNTGSAIETDRRRPDSPDVASVVCVDRGPAAGAPNRTEDPSVELSHPDMVTIAANAPLTHRQRSTEKGYARGVRRSLSGCSSPRSHGLAWSRAALVTDWRRALA